MGGLRPTEDDFFKDDERGYYFIPIDDLLKYQLPKVQNQKCHFMIFHTPTKCNFWHISIRLLNNNYEEISTLNLNKNAKHKIWKTAKDFLIEDIIKQKIDNYSTIPKFTYSDIIE